MYSHIHIYPHTFVYIFLYVYINMPTHIQVKIYTPPLDNQLYNTSDTADLLRRSRLVKMLTSQLCWQFTPYNEQWAEFWKCTQSCPTPTLEILKRQPVLTALYKITTIIIELTFGKFFEKLYRHVDSLLVGYRLRPAILTAQIQK